MAVNFERGGNDGAVHGVTVSADLPGTVTRSLLIPASSFMRETCSYSLTPGKNEPSWPP